MSAPRYATLLAGYGYAGSKLHAPLIGAEGGLDLQAVVSSDPGKVAADRPGLQVYPDLATALAARRFDLVVLATPDRAHAEGARAALEAGAAVVVEKPFALTLAEARELTALARARSRGLFVFHNRRFDSDFLTLKDLMDRGALGEIRLFESRFDRYRPMVRERWREAAGAGVFNDLAPHLIDHALALFGPPDGVFADFAMLRPGALAVDDFRLILDYPSRRVLLSASMSASGAGLRFRVDGEKAAYIKHGLDAQEGRLVAGLAPDAPGFGDDLEPGLLIDPATGARRPADPAPGRWRDFYAEVAEALSGRGRGPSPAEEALLVVEVMETARASAREGRRMAFAPVKD
jgi:predicted dehydrogenase